MRVRWLGQSAFHLAADREVAIDPFGDVAEALAERGMRFAYPPIRDVRADLVLVTHEHRDHNGVEAIAGDPQVLRSTAGRLDSPVGEVVAIASEHDDAAGTERGPNTIFSFVLGGLRVCHFGDFGQAELRAAQAAQLERPDVLLLPVGGGPTIDGGKAAGIVRELRPRWVVPMHYRTDAVSFLEPPDAFLGAFPQEDVLRLDGPELDTGELPAREGTLAVVPAPPV
jgi:L-ascorbate metabolism protein UlaG (beta-lactamase superfamily)